MYKLLTKNAKLIKNKKYNTVGLALAPHKQSGYNVCHQATKSCSEICVLWTRGMTVQPQVRKAMTRRTHLLFQDRAKFLEQLHKELKTHNNRQNPLCRLNVASDLPFWKIDETLYTKYPNIIFYGYTKVWNYAKDYIQGKLPENLHLTYSWSERSDKRKTNWFLKNGGNVAMVLNCYYVPGKPLGKLPATVKIATKTHSVVDGDISDARLPSLDGSGNIVALRAKVKKSLKQKYINSGFIVDKPFKV